MSPEEFVRLTSAWGKSRTPFFFLLDFEGKNPQAFLWEEAATHGIFFRFKNQGNATPKKNLPGVNWAFSPISFSEYQRRFNLVHRHILQGDSYLLNLTFPSQVQTDRTLEELFHLGKAPYQLLFQDRFAVFSPEGFVKMEGEEIATFPMKGTLDGSVDRAEEVLLANTKEEWEHNTVVDLLRNDLAMVAKKIRVVRYRYTERIPAGGKEIVQSSSEIRGTLPENWQENIGDILLRLLPAGSITGAPKAKTVEIIRAAELDERGYYCGVFGIFDGEKVESAVAIRFLEKRDGAFYFRSGGGITALSQAEEEYQELQTKVYVPFV
ncbi:aminodeoxychorismate synthase component I [Algoriphagus confluentis]|uniref:Aminodeoxychorismate synthase component I n=1 Tax=Algoriphagus confluentis TaxID=1697556 RepID=A0ABQ6PL16_9BACT|nr:aminodeoxychorismate synthase component I [Algoriphagus confluentis]